MIYLDLSNIFGREQTMVTWQIQGQNSFSFEVSFKAFQKAHLELLQWETCFSQCGAAHWEAFQTAVSQHNQCTGLIHQQARAKPAQSSASAYVYDRTKRAVTRGNRGKVATRESICARLYLRDKDLQSRRKKLSAAGLPSSKNTQAKKSSDLSSLSPPGIHFLSSPLPGLIWEALCCWTCKL